MERAKQAQADALKYWSEYRSKLIKLQNRKVDIEYKIRLAEIDVAQWDAVYANAQKEIERIAKDEIEQQHKEAIKQAQKPIQIEKNIE